jgi:hypothetical protein
MSINLPQMSKGLYESGRLGGGQVPLVGLNPPLDTSGRDPINSFGTPVSASQTSPVSGPIRPVHFSLSLAPYDSGFKMPRAQRMLSAAQAASLSRRRETMSPSPAPSVLLLVPPLGKGGRGSPFMSLGSPTPSATSKGWHRPEQYVGALRTDVVWLDKLWSGTFGELSETDKLRVTDGIGNLIQAAYDAGVLFWSLMALESAMGQILASDGEDEENHSTHFDQDVDMRLPLPLMAWPGPSSGSCRCVPKGGA